MKQKLRSVLTELQKRDTKVFKLEDYLFDKQLAFVTDPSPFKVAVTTRRAGKSVSCVADLTNECLSTPNVICLYITLSRKNAKRLVWPLFKKLNRDYKLGGEPNESDLSISYPNGSMLYLLGAKDRASIEDFRGMPVKKAYLDESQSFPGYIAELIDDVLGPALLDHAGSLCLIGTPGPVPSGYFYDLTKNKKWAHHSWSYFDNSRLPYLKKGVTHHDALKRELDRRGVSMEDPSIQREWFGRWVLDTNSLVFRYTEDKNHYATLPIKTWTYILGVDLGFNDADALALLAWSPEEKATYLVKEVVTKKQTISDLISQIEELKKTYDISKIVVDTGGLGKKIAEELSRRYKTGVMAAEKVRKHEYIELLNDALRTGTLKAPATSQFAQDCMKVEWDLDKSTPDRKVVSDRFHSDICDAVLYAWRESYSFTYEAPKVKPTYGTPAWQQEERDRLEAEAEEYFKNLEDVTKLDPFDPY